jgi:hypothetical protein
MTTSQFEVSRVAFGAGSNTTDDEQALMRKIVSGRDKMWLLLPLASIEQQASS